MTTLTLNSIHARAFNELGVEHWHQNQLSKAITCHQRALELNPQCLEAHANLGLILAFQGRLEEAIYHNHQVLALDPSAAKAYSNLLLTLNYSDQLTPAMLFQAHQQFDERYALPLTLTIQPSLHLPPLSAISSSRRLKIGYLSGDFKKHAVTYFLAPILAHHNHQQFEIFCYYNNTIIDHITTRLQDYADNWINCYSLTDEALASRIREDGIDILVDLSGHTGRNRLLVLARKPAPIQMTFLGYPNTTGLTAIDYRITDQYVDAQGINDHFNSETLIKLPHSFFCYQPVADGPAVNQLPALDNNYITFGSFNNLAKLSPTILRLWANVLEAVPGSKLLIKDRCLREDADREAFTQRVANYGITAAQLILEEYEMAPGYLKTYHQVDLALDTYPYNGGLTTCEALWMGIPVITLVGTKSVSRLGLSILSTLGLTELITENPQDYVQTAVNLAVARDYLQQLRAELRTRMNTSPLMAAASFTRSLESIYNEFKI